MIQGFKLRMEWDNHCFNFSLIMANLWIGLSRGAGGLPKDIRLLGYTDSGVEFRFNNSKREVVEPDLILVSTQLNHTLLLEWKSGANVDNNQLQRYSHITKEDLEQRAFIEPPASNNHDIALVGVCNFSDRLRQGVEIAQVSFPILVTDDRCIVLCHNSFGNPKLNDLFGKGLEVNLANVPTQFIPFNEKSDTWEVAESVIPLMLEHMHQRRPILTVDAICKDVCNIWDQMGRDSKVRFRSKVEDVLNKAARGPFHKYLRKRRSHNPPHFEIVNNPLNLSIDKRSRAFRKLKKLQEEFIENLRYRGSEFEQIPLDF